MLTSKDYKLKADEYANLMKSNFEQSQNAWKNGDKANAKLFSDKGNEYKYLLMETNKNFNEVIKIEKEQKKNYNLKEYVISSIVDEKNKYDFKKLSNNKTIENQENNSNFDQTENNNAIDSQYNDFRSKADYYAKEMVKSFQDSKLSWEKGDKGKAKEFSDLGYENQKNMEIYNSLAVKLIATKNNIEREADEIDLHGLFVNEAIDYFKKTITIKMKNDNFQSIRVIVGKGLHSKDKPKIKYAIANFAAENKLQVFEEPENEGCLIIFI